MRNLDEASLSPDANQQKKHQGDGSPEKRGDTQLRAFPARCYQQICSVVNKISIDKCCHCNKTCNADGAKGEAFQCD